MKKILSLLAFALLTATFCGAAESLTKPADAYAQAVAAYVEAANREMVALRTKVEAMTKSADDQGKAKCEEIKRQLDESDRLLERLTSANRTNFDKIKSAYEQARNEAVKAIDEQTKN